MRIRAAIQNPGMVVRQRAGTDGVGRRVLAPQQRALGLAALRSEVLASSRQVIDVDDPSGST